MNGADLVIKVLQEHGVSFISTLCGNGLAPLYSACVRAGMRLVDTRNEQAAAYMADAYARLTGRLGVCAVSSGIAHLNALAGVANAWFDGAPLLLITGESATASGRGKFQEMDHPAIAAPICKASKRVEQVERLEFELREMLAQAMAGRPGPVHLALPEDVQRAEVVFSSGRENVPVPSPSRGAGDSESVRRALEWIAAARRPLLVLGSGCFYARAGEMARAFMELTDIPTVVPIWDRGVVARGTKQFLGVIGAASGSPPLLPETDLLVLVGARADYRVAYALPPGLNAEARVIRVDVDAAELSSGTPAHLNILGDPASVLASWCTLWQECGAKPHTAWLDKARGLDATFRARWQTLPPAPPMTGRHVVEALRPFLGEETILLIDGGNIGQWAHMCLCDGYPAHWLTCGASAVVGWGLGGAMGARLAYPNRPIILLSGDGSIGFTLADLESATRQKLPFVVVLADDRAWGIVVSGQRKRGPQEVVASCLGPVCYDLVAEGLGALGLRAERPEEIGPAIRRGLEAGRPALVHVPIVPQGPSDV